MNNIQFCQFGHNKSGGSFYSKLPPGTGILEVYWVQTWAFPYAPDNYYYLTNDFIRPKNESMLNLGFQMNYSGCSYDDYENIKSRVNSIRIICNGLYQIQIFDEFDNPLTDLFSDEVYIYEPTGGEDNSRYGTPEYEMIPKVFKEADLKSGDYTSRNVFFKIYDKNTEEVSEMLGLTIYTGTDIPPNF